MRYRSSAVLILFMTTSINHICLSNNIEQEMQIIDFSKVNTSCGYKYIFTVNMEEALAKNTYKLRRIVSYSLQMLYSK